MRKPWIGLAAAAFWIATLAPAHAAAAPAPAPHEDSVAYGRTVDAATGRPVPFVLVIAYQEDYATPISATISNRRGGFVVRGLPDEEFALRYVGAWRGYETGWQACDRSVVPTTGAACTQSPGPQGRIRLDRIR